MSRKIQIQLQRSQMEILAQAITTIHLDDLQVYGGHVATMMDYFISRIKDRVISRLENRETNKRKFKLSFHPAEAAALMQTYSRMQFNSATEAQLLRTVLMELDRNI